MKTEEVTKAMPVLKDPINVDAGKAKLIEWAIQNNLKFKFFTEKHSLFGGTTLTLGIVCERDIIPPTDEEKANVQNIMDFIPKQMEVL